jgi:hypothetical protein
MRIDEVNHPNCFVSGATGGSALVMEQHGNNFALDERTNGMALLCVFHVCLGRLSAEIRDSICCARSGQTAIMAVTMVLVSSNWLASELQEKTEEEEKNS